VERWTDFAVIIGGGFAALLGLLFVAISIKADIIRRSGTLRARATQTMIPFLMALLAAAILGIPGQPLWVFAALVLTLGIVEACAHLIMDRRAKRAKDESSLGRTLSAITPSAVTSILVIAAGVAALLGWNGGVYILAGGTIAALTGAVINAWLFLVRLGD
jgi:hypothetical protein